VGINPSREFTRAIRFLFSFIRIILVKISRPRVATELSEMMLHKDILAPNSLPASVYFLPMIYLAFSLWQVPSRGYTLEPLTNDQNFRRDMFHIWVAVKLVVNSPFAKKRTITVSMTTETLNESAKALVKLAMSFWRGRALGPN
jgi:hypothetical protein